VREEHVDAACCSGGRYSGVEGSIVIIACSIRVREAGGGKEGGEERRGGGEELRALERAVGAVAPTVRRCQEAQPCSRELLMAQVGAMRQQRRSSGWANVLMAEGRGEQRRSEGYALRGRGGGCLQMLIVIARDDDSAGTRLLRLRGSVTLCENASAMDVRGGGYAGGVHHPRVERGILRLAIRGGKLAAHEHYVAAVAEHVARRHAHGVVAAVRIAHKHHACAAGALGRYRGEVLILDGRVLQGIGKEDAGRAGAAHGVPLRLPERPEAVEHAANRLLRQQEPRLLVGGSVFEQEQGIWFEGDGGGDWGVTFETEGMRAE
jgi:hypothetical protein